MTNEKENKNLQNEEKDLKVTKAIERTNDEIRAEIEAKKKELEKINLNKELANLNDQIAKANEIPQQKTSDIATPAQPAKEKINTNQKNDYLDQNDPQKWIDEIAEKNKNKTNNRGNK